MRDLLCLAAVVTALGGCAHLHDATSHPEKPRPPRICHEVDVAEPIDPEQACPSWRRVALKTNPDGECPDPAADDEALSGKWTVGHLFAADSTSARESEQHAAALPPALRPFCLYVYEEYDARALESLNQELDALVGDVFERVDNGCAAVGPAADGEADPEAALWKGLEDYFLDQVGDVEPVASLGSKVSSGGCSEPRVRLSFLDTQPVARSDRDVNSEHGYSLAQMARKIVCDEPVSAGRCAAEVDYRLALPIERFVRGNPEETIFDPLRGGYSGSVDMLATAVWDAVRDESRSPRQHLVLNLSLAWDGELFGGLEADVADMPATVQALYRALEVASCRGALAVAAAGNRRGGPEQERGPLLPGGWERRDAPSADACRRILGLEPESRRPSCEASKEPLVYAAGGVRHDDSPLYNSRAGATPARVAYASHAQILPPAPDGDPMKPLTGTSVATAVISAAASVVWHHWPHLERAELMDLLYRAGTPIDGTADFYHSSFGEPPGVRRVAVCPAMQLACAEHGGTCPPPCDAPVESPMAMCWEPSCSDPSKVRTVDASQIVEQLEDLPFCGDRTILYDPAMGMPTDPCPSKQFYHATAKAWEESTLPAPEDTPCSACGGSGGGAGGLAAGLAEKAFECRTSNAGSLWIEIDPEWEKTLSQAFLDVGDYSLALGVGELNGGDCVLVENVDFAALAGGELNPYVTLRFRTDDRRVVSVPLQF